MDSTSQTLTSTTTSAIPQRLSSIFAHLRSLNINSYQSLAVDANGNLLAYLDFTLDEADHHYLRDGFPELLELSIGHSVPHEFDPATGQLRIMTLPTSIHEALSHHLYHGIYPFIADNTLGIDMYWKEDPKQVPGAHQVLLCSYGSYTQAGATLGFVLEDAECSEAKLTKGYHVLAANPSLKVVVTFHLSIARDGWLGNAKAMARSAEHSFITVAVRDKAGAPVQGGPYRRKVKEQLGTEGGSIKLWVSDFVADEELLPEKDRRLGSAGGADESRKANIEIPYQSILKVLAKVSDLNNLRAAAEEQQTTQGGAGARVATTPKGPNNFRRFSTAAKTIGNSRVLAALRGGDNVDRFDTPPASSGTAIHHVIGAPGLSQLGASSAADGHVATPAVSVARVRGVLPGTPGRLGLGLVRRAFSKAASHLKK